MFNKTTPKKKKEIVRNEAGGYAYKLTPTRALFAQLTSFKPKSSYYLSEQDKLDIMMEAMRNCDLKEAIALAHYAATELGMRLGPALVLARALPSHQQEVIEKVVQDVYVRPDMIANALGYLKHVNNGRSFMDGLSLDLAMAFRKTLESYKEHTLIRRKMLSREVKLKDLIKTLRPRPSSPHMSKLYKEIIEDGPMSKLKVTKGEDGKVKADHVTAVLSSTVVDTREKEQYISDNIGNIPIKALIANARQLKNSDVVTMCNRLDDALQNGAKRYINPLDILQLNVNAGYTPSDYGTKWTHSLKSPFSPAITAAFENMIDRYYDFDVECNAPLIMFDVSGSMGSTCQDDGLALGLRYLALMRTLIRKPHARVIAFDMSNKDVTAQMKKIAKLKPYAFIESAAQILRPSGGTSLIECTTDALREGRHDALIIFTDEQTWFDTQGSPIYATRLTDMINKFGLAGQTAIVNVCPSNTSVVANSASVVRVSGTNANILTALEPMFNWSKFVASLVTKLFGPQRQVA